MAAAEKFGVGQVLAWMRDLGDRVITAGEKQEMAQRTGVAGPRVAAGFSVALVVDPAQLGVRVTRYELENGVGVELARKGDGSELWAVRDGTGDCLTRDGEWVPEPQPSSRDADFLARCRFPSADRAITAARSATERV